MAEDQVLVLAVLGLPVAATGFVEGLRLGEVVVPVGTGWSVVGNLVGPPKYWVEEVLT